MLSEKADGKMAKHSELTTGEISKILGVNITQKYLESLKFQPTFKTSVGSYWSKEDIPAICMGISADISYKGIQFLKENN